MNKKNVLEILDYMFEFIFSDSNFKNGMIIDDLTIKNYLANAGFEAKSIDDALNYLVNSSGNNKQVIEDVSPKSHASIRMFNSIETKKIGKKGCALLLFLETRNKLSARCREIIIEHVMKSHYYYNFDDFLWLAQLAILNQNSNNLSEILKENEDCLTTTSLKN